MKRIVVIALLSAVFGSSWAAGDAQAGKELVTSAGCVACHGPDGNSPSDLYPKLAGQNARYIEKQLLDFQLGAKTEGKEGRNNAVMWEQSKNLTAQQIADLAAFFSSQKTEAGVTQEQFVEAGQKLFRGGDAANGIAACIGCHGPRGMGNDPARFPQLSGQHPTYIIAQLQAFRAGERANDPNGMMRLLAARLTDKQIEALAHYLSGLH